MSVTNQFPVDETVSSHRPHQLKLLVTFLAAPLVWSLTSLSAAPVQWSVNGHYYDFIRTNITWHNAKTAATQLTFQGLPGHLATITSAPENEFITTTFGTRANAQFAWVAGREPANDGVWRWDAGPEAGMQFSFWATPKGPFNFANWGGVEPNNNKWQEDYLMLNLGQTFNGISKGRWADASPTPSFSDPVIGFVVEFESSCDSQAETPASTEKPIATPTTPARPGTLPAPLANTVEIASSNSVVASIYTAAEVCWTSQLGARYQVQWTRAFESGDWNSLGEPIQANSTSTCVFDSTRGQQIRFYRVLRLP